MPFVLSHVALWAFPRTLMESFMALVPFKPQFPSIDFLGPFARRKNSSLVQRQNNLHICVTNTEHGAKNCCFPMLYCALLPDAIDGLA